MSSNQTPASGKTKRILKKTGKILFRILLVMVLLLFLIIGLIQVPGVQNYLKNKVVSALNSKLNTTIKLGHIRINFAGNLVVEDLFIADRQQDTVINAGKIKVAFNPSGLFQKKVIITNVAVEKTNINYLILDEAGRTNIDFIINSFSGDENKEKPDSESSWDIQLRKIQLNKSRFSFHHLSDSMDFDISIGHFLVDIKKNNLDSLVFDIDQILLENARVNLISYKLIEKVEAFAQKENLKEQNDTSKNLFVSISKIDLNSVSFQQFDSLTGSGGFYHIGKARILPELIDMSSQTIAISSLTIQQGEVNYTSAKGPSKTEKEEVENGNSWKIQLDKGKMHFDRIRLNNLMPDTGALSYLSAISISNVDMDVAVYFAQPSWNVSLASLNLVDDRTNRLISLMANSQSNGQKIDIQPFRISIGKSHISGNAGTLIASDKTGTVPEINAQIKSSNIFLSDFVSYLPKSMYSNLNRIPAQLNLVADIQTKNNVMAGSGVLKTNEGIVRFDGNLNQVNSSYDIKVGFTNIDAGFFAQNPELGMVSANLKATGSGFNPDSMQTDLELLIPAISYKGITYDDIQLSGNINHGEILANLTINDPIASMASNIKGTLGKQPFIRVNNRIKRLDLFAMKLIEDTIALKGVIDVVYAGKGPGRFITNSDTFKVDILTPDDVITTDSRLSYTVLGDTVEARIYSNFGNIAYDGNVPLQNVPVIIKAYFNRYFAATEPDTVLIDNKYFKLDMLIKDLDVLNDFIATEIDIPEEAKIVAELINNQLTADINIEKIILKELEIDELLLEADGRDSAFVLSFKTGALHNNIHTIRDISLESSLQEGILESRFMFSNADSRKWFNIGVGMEPRNPELNMVIREPLMLSHKEWEVDENNKTYIRNDNIVFSNVRLVNGDMLISLLSDARQPEKLAVNFKNLNLALLSEIMKGDTSFLSGNVDGSLMATNLFAKPAPSFDARLDISNIVLENRPLGELNIIAANTKNNDIAEIDLSFGREEMRLNLDGTYGLKESIPMDLNFSTQNLNLTAIQPLMQDLLSDASGNLNASLNLTGSFAKPVVKGEITFDKVAAFIEPIQARYAIDQQTIRFRGDGIDFNNFTINDVDGSELNINGKVELVDLKNLRYDLRVKSDEFLAYQGPQNNLPGKDNKVIITTDLEVTGQNMAPVVNANVHIIEDSRFFYKITKKASTLTEDGIVDFDGKVIEEENVPETSIAENLNLTANIELANNTAVTIITDPVRNLGLNMEAGGTFSLSQRPYQAMRLTGRLDISGGDYTISLSGLKRKFEIADSSYIEWYGNIAEPELNLRAYYEVRTSPAALLANQSGETSSTLPFNVNVLISGSLEEPQLNFRLSLPREYEGMNNGLIAAKLQEINSNESELNQKAMALLLFGSFGFDNIAGVLSNNAGANVIISNALNQLASQKLKFIDLHFDLESYDNYGSASEDNLRTEMKVAASRKFADDRLNVQLGATFVLQADEQEQQQSVADKISPEFNIEYMLNTKRTVSVNAFRRSEYRGLVEGKVISTGAGIQYSKDFNKISELFRKPEETSVAENQQDIDEDK
jgi:hypothetical protein